MIFFCWSLNELFRHGQVTAGPDLLLVDALVQCGGGEEIFFQEENANNFNILKS